MSNSKSILKNTAIFGSVKFISLVIGLVRTKLAAVLLGTQGVGFFGLIAATIELIIGIFNAGIPTSMVKYLSVSTDEDLPKKFYIARKITLGLAILGLLFCFIFAEKLSDFTFGTNDFRWAFQLLSIAVFTRILLIAFNSYLQSRIYLKTLANAAIVGNILGIFCTIPLYYFFRIDGVVYNIVAIALIDILVIYIAFRKIKQPVKKVSHQEFSQDSKNILTESFYYSFAGILAVLSAYIVQIYIRKSGDLDELGLFVTGNTIINQYVAIVFMSMSYDYFPRISKAAKDIVQLNKEVNQQLKIGLIVLFPILLWLLLLCDWVVRLLFSKDFLGSVSYVEIAILGVFFKMISWILAYTLIAKSQKKIFVINEFIFTILYIGIHLYGFQNNQITGLGIAYSVYFFLYLLAIFFICKYKTKVEMNSQNFKISVLFSFLILFSIIIKIFVTNPIAVNVLLGILTIFASIWSLRQIVNIYAIKNH